MGLFTAIVSFLALFSSFTAANPLSKRASLTQVTNFGSNPSGTLMYIYVPNKLATKPAIIVAIHYCSGTASAYYSGSPYAQLAEQYGFIVIYPQSPYSGTCWDVSSKAALTHDGGADSNSIANMVTYTLQKYSGDASRVYVTGSSSGAMMTNVMAATYPEMFAAGIAYGGVPAGCFYTGTVNGWNGTCSSGKVIASQAYWASTVKAMYPGYTGARPKMQIYHGTADTTLYPQNYNETIKEWTGVFGYSATPASVRANYPLQNWYTETYGPNVQGVYGIGVGHTPPIQGASDMAFFGFTGNNNNGGGSTTTTKAATPAPTATTPAGGSGGGTVAQWGQILRIVGSLFFGTSLSYRGQYDVTEEYDDVVLAKRVEFVVDKYELGIKRQVKYPDSVSDVSNCQNVWSDGHSKGPPTSKWVATLKQLIAAYRQERIDPDRNNGTTSLFSLKQQALVAEVQGSAVYRDVKTGRSVDIRTLGGSWPKLYEGFTKKGERARELKPNWDREHARARSGNSPRDARI
ncbi:MAG: hypothetical protein Q9160_004065 [Pyrenula sp. 1 TL-2023]